MKHWTPLACVFLLASSGTTAQTVFIPDTNLRAELNAWVPGAVDVNGMMDTANPLLQATTTLNLHVYWDPVDLTGLEAMTWLGTLTITNGYLLPLPEEGFMQGGTPHAVTIPAWPPNLANIQVEGFSCAALPPWPAQVTSLGCRRLYGSTNLPAIPSLVTELSIWASPDLVSFPNIPEGVSYIELEGQPGLSVPALPNSSNSIQLIGFDVTTLADWPTGVLFFNLVSMSGLTALPPWPPSTAAITLVGLDGVQTIPAPPASTGGLWVVGWPLATLPELPNGLSLLQVAALDITELPELPSSLTDLSISGCTQLHCLPLLPDALQRIDIDLDYSYDGVYTPINCLPNLPVYLYHFAIGPESTSLPLDQSVLCTVLNSTCEFVNPVASGTVYWDQNANGARDSGEPGYACAEVNVQPGNYIHGVQADGSYQLALPFDQYTLNATSINPHVLSIAPSAHDAPFASMTDVDAGNDFGVVLSPGVQDLRVDLLAPIGRPGFDSNGWITCTNWGSVVVNATVTLELDAAMQFVGSSPAPTSTAGNTITWDLSGFGVGASSTIQFTVYTGVTVAVGTVLDHSAQIDPIQSDVAAADNVSIEQTQVVASVDPNEKRVAPASVSTQALLEGQEVCYTINFQNTGNHQADRVLITDTLSADLQWDSFRFISSSHVCTWVLLGDGTLRFLFDPITLPDSTSNEPDSHGFVRFGIKPDGSLPNGASVSNTANIYFDFNEAVVTEPSVLLVQDPLAVPATRHGSFQLQPNPVSNTLLLKVPSATHGTMQARVIDAGGRTVMTQMLLAQRTAMDVSGLAPGSYLLQVDVDGERHSQRFVKQ